MIGISNYQIKHQANTCCLNAQRKRRVMHIPGEKVHNSRELQKQKLLCISICQSIYNL